jgi:hypothetical protein
MLPYTAGDGLQVIAREFGIDVTSATENNPFLARTITAFWKRMWRPFSLLTAR